MFAEVHLGIAVDDAYVGVGFVFVLALLEPADGEGSVNVDCRAAFARWFSLN
jgi:hypothetical protein